MFNTLNMLLWGTDNNSKITKKNLLLFLKSCIKTTLSNPMKVQGTVCVCVCILALRGGADLCACDLEGGWDDRLQSHPDGFGLHHC